MAEERLHLRRRRRARRSSGRWSCRDSSARAVGRALLRRRDQQNARAEIRRRRALSERPARCRRRSTPSCRKRPIVRSIADCGGSTSGMAAFASPRATCSPRSNARRLRSPSIDGTDRSSPATSCPRWSTTVCAEGRQRQRARPDLTHEVELPKARVRVDAQDVRRRPLQGRRPDPGRGPQRPGRRAADARARAGSDRRRCAAGDRQPHRPGPRDGWRLQLSCGASSTARRRRSVRSDRRSSRSSTRRRSIAAITPVSIFVDEPISSTRVPNQPPYEPLNYDRKYEGPVTLRRALEDSRNVPAVKALAELGPANVDQGRGAFRLPPNMPPYLSLALGSVEGDAVGHDQRLHRVPEPGRSDAPRTRSSASRTAKATCSRRTGPSRTKAIRADTAFVMTNLLRGVVQRGTRGGRGQPRLAAWPARPARWTSTPMRGSSASIRTSRSACGSATTKRSRSGNNETGAIGGAADLDGLHEGLHRHARRPEERAAVRGARQHRLRDARQRHSAKPSSTATQPQGAVAVPAVSPASN